jgi:hypothetical protein
MQLEELSVNSLEIQIFPNVYEQTEMDFGKTPKHYTKCFAWASGFFKFKQTSENTVQNTTRGKEMRIYPSSKRSGIEDHVMCVERTPPRRNAEKE